MQVMFLRQDESISGASDGGLLGDAKASRSSCCYFVLSDCMVADLGSVPLVEDLFGVAPSFGIRLASLGWRLVKIAST